MTPFNPAAAWVTRLTETLHQGAPQIVCDPQDLSLLLQILESNELPESAAQVGTILQQACADVGLSCSLPEDFLTLTCHAPLLRLTFRLLLEDLLHLQQTREPVFTWAQDGENCFCLSLPISRQTLWRHYFLVGADFVTTADPFVEYRRLWLGYLLHSLAQSHLLIETDSQAPGTSRFVFSVQLLPRSSTPLTAAAVLTSYAHTLQLSQQRLASFYQLRRLNPELTAYTCNVGATPGRLNPKYLVIDGVHEGAGRTSILMNLAYCFAAECGLNVLCLTTDAEHQQYAGGWKMPPWDFAEAPQDDSYCLLDFHRQIRPVRENLSILGYWHGYDKFWEQTLRSQCSEFDLVLIEMHAMEMEQDNGAWRLADLVLFCGGLAQEEETYLASYVDKPREFLTFESLPVVPFRTLLQQGGEKDLAQLRTQYQQAGASALTSEIVVDKAYGKSLRARLPVLEHAPQSAASTAFRAAAEEILRLLYGL